MKINSVKLFIQWTFSCLLHISLLLFLSPIEVRLIPSTNESTERTNEYLNERQCEVRQKAFRHFNKLQIWVFDTLNFLNSQYLSKALRRDHFNARRFLRRAKRQALVSYISIYCLYRQAWFLMHQKFCFVFWFRWINFTFQVVRVFWAMKQSTRAVRDVNIIENYIA